MKFICFYIIIKSSYFFNKFLIYYSYILNKKLNMVQIVFGYKQGKYPFGRGEPGPDTYFQYLKNLNSDQEVNKAKEINQILKVLDESCVLKLKRIFKEDNTLHMLYEYIEHSLIQKLEKLQEEQELTDIFVALESCFQTLIKNKLKAEVYIEYMGIDPKGKLKIWLKPDQCQICEHKKQLEQFYQTQRTRIHLQVQQILQNHQKNNAKTATGPTQQQKPNFVINGNQLVFQGNQKLVKSHENMTKNNSEKQKSEEIPSQNQRPISTISSKTNEKQVKQKNNNQIISQQKKGEKEKKSNTTQNEKHQKCSVNDKILQKQKILLQKIDKSGHQKQKQKPSSKQNLNIQAHKTQTTHQITQKQKPIQKNVNTNLNIRTELINKHKMRIITSQEIELEGYNQKDLQKLANQKLKQLGKNANLGKIQFEQIEDTKSKGSSQHSSNRNTFEGKQYLKQDIQKKGNISHHSSQSGTSGNKNNLSAEMNDKINKAKERARQVLQQYSKKGKNSKPEN